MIKKEFLTEQEMRDELPSAKAMKQPRPTVEEWRQLYAAAVRFRDLKCWEWMEDCDLFGVQNPEDGQIGYCCVLGNAGEVFGLAVYPGTDGLHRYFALLEAPDDMEGNLDFYMENSDCVKVEFVDQSELQPEDRRILKQLGLSFEGRNQWPTFQRFLPGYHPWSISGKEARLLLVCLDQAIAVATEARTNSKLLEQHDEERILVRVPSGDGPNRSWSAEWLKPAPLEPTVMLAVSNELWEQVRDAKFPRAGTWECDVFFSTQIIREQGDKPPYQARIALILDYDSEKVLHIEPGRPEDGILTLQKALAETIQKLESVPRKVLVGRDIARHALEPAAAILDVEIQVVKRLPLVDRVRAQMNSFLDRK
jgi:hypothetical protein